MTSSYRPSEGSPLVTGIGIAHVAYGLLIVGLGIWVLAAGGEAASRVLLANQEVKKLGKSAPVPEVPKDKAKQIGAIADVASQGIAGIFLAMATIAAGCLIVQGLPLIGIGLGVVYRKQWARILTFLFAILTFLQGMGLAAGSTSSPSARAVGFGFIVFALVSYMGLLTQRAKYEFTGKWSPGLAPAGIDTPSTAEAESIYGKQPATSGNAGKVVLLVGGTAALTVGIVFLAQNLSGRAKDKPKEKVEEVPITTMSDEEKGTAFHKAIDKGQVSQAMNLIRAGVHPDDRDTKDETALLRVAGKGHTRMVILLLSTGAQPNEKSAKGETALIRAASAGHGAVVSLLLGKDDVLAQMRALRASLAVDKLPDMGKINLKDVKIPDIKIPALPVIDKVTVAEVNARDASGQTALMHAARNGHSDIVKMLVASSADREVVDREGMMAWMLAASAGHEDAMVALLPINPSREYLNRKNRQGKSAYELAAADGHATVIAYLRPKLGELVKEVVVVPPKVGVTGNAAKSPLFIAINAGQLAIVQAYLTRGDSLEGRDDKGRTPLILAAMKGDAKMVLLLVNAVGTTKPDLFEAVDLDGRTALMHAAAAGHSGAVEGMLLALTGAFNRGKVNWFRHLEQKDKQGKTAHGLALSAGHKTIAEKLQAYTREHLDSRSTGASKSALEMAAEANDLGSVEGLLRLKATQIPSTSSADRTALMWAAEAGHILVVRALLDAVADSKADRDRLLNWTWYERIGSSSVSRSTEFLAERAKKSEIVAMLQKERTRTNTTPIVNPNVLPRTPMDRTLATTLVKAIDASDAEAVETFLSGGGSIQGADTEGRNAIMLAAAKGNHKIVLLLSARFRTTENEQIFAVDKQGRTAMIHAAAGGHDETVESLLIAMTTAWTSGRMNWFLFLDHPDKTGKPALAQAEAKGHKKVVTRLTAAYKTHLDDFSKGYARTAVELASERGDVTMLKRLLAKGASVQPGGVSTALQLAATNGHLKVVQALLESFGKDGEKRIAFVKKRPNESYATALMEASSAGHLLMVQALMDAFGEDKKTRAAYVKYSRLGGYNVYLKGRYVTEKDSIKFAKDNNHLEIATLLEKYAKGE